MRIIILRQLKDILIKSSKINTLSKLLYRVGQAVCLHERPEPKLIFIFGCQRSGTTLLQKLLSLSARIAMYGEGDAPYFYPESDEILRLRLRPPEQVRAYLKSEQNEFTVLKPLYETESLAKFATAFCDAERYFIFRHYKAVINSHLTFYQLQDYREYLKPLFTANSKHWMCLNLPELTQQKIARFCLDKISASDAYALYWVARNSVAMSQMDDSVHKVHYEDLIKKPRESIQKIFAPLDIAPKPYWQWLITQNNRPSPDIELSPAIEQLCEETFQQLLKIYSE